MKTQTLKLALVGSLLVQASAQADVTTTLLGAATVATTYAGWRASDKDPKPENKLVTKEDVKNGKATLSEYVDDRIIGQDEQGAAVTDYKPCTVVDEKASDWQEVNLTDAVTGKVVKTYQRVVAPTLQTTYVAQGALPYCKAKGLSLLRTKTLKKIHSGVGLSAVLYGGLWIANTGYQLVTTGSFDNKGAFKHSLKKIRNVLGAVAIITTGLGTICPSNL